MKQSELLKQKIITDFKNGIADEWDVAVARFDIIMQIIEEDKAAMEVAS